MRHKYKAKEIWHQVDLAKECLPGHVRQAVDELLHFRLDYIYEKRERQVGDRVVKERSVGMINYACFGFEECKDYGKYDECKTCPDKDTPTVVIDRRIDFAPKRIILHEIAHFWMALRQNELGRRRFKNNERRAHLLAQLWLMRGVRAATRPKVLGSHTPSPAHS